MRKLYLIGLLFVLLVLAGCLQSQPTQTTTQPTQPTEEQPTSPPTPPNGGMQEQEEQSQPTQQILAGEKVKCVLNITTNGKKTVDAVYYLKEKDTRIEQTIYQDEMNSIEIISLIIDDGRETYSTLPVTLGAEVNNCEWIKQTYSSPQILNNIQQFEDYIGKGKQTITIGESTVEIECFKEEFDDSLLNPPTEGVCSEEEMIPEYPQ